MQPLQLMDSLALALLQHMTINLVYACTLVYHIVYAYIMWCMCCICMVKYTVSAITEVAGGVVQTGISDGDNLTRAR